MEVLGKGVWRRPLAVVTLFLLVPVPTGDASQATPRRGGSSVPSEVSIGEVSLRQRTLSSPKPAYPPEVEKAGIQGVVVAAVTIDSAGRFVNVDVLESPHRTLSDAVTLAVRNWRIRPITVGTGQPVSTVTSLLTFYFTTQAGKASVLSPQEMMKTRPAVSARGGPQSSIRPISLEEYEAMRTAGPVTLLDVRERSLFRRRHEPGAINVPRSEIYVRGVLELTSDIPVVVDCRRDAESSCTIAGRVLLDAGFVSVFILLP